MYPNEIIRQVCDFFDRTHFIYLHIFNALRFLYDYAKYKEYFYNDTNRNQKKPQNFDETVSSFVKVLYRFPESIETCIRSRFCVIVLECLTSL